MTFKPGQSGNPAGRPRGTRNASTKLREQIAADLPGILETLVSAARSGDVSAARVLIDRCLPPLRAESAAVSLPAVAKAESLTDAGRAVLDAVAAGRLAPETGRELIGALASLGRVAEIDELERRLCALEAQTNDDH